MKVYLEYQQDNSSKFWEGKVEGTSLSVTFGKIGTQGQTKVKEFASGSDAKKELDKLVKEKKKKGYVEIGEEVSVSSEEVEDTGEKKPWFDESYWEYSWYCPDEESFDNLSKQEELTVSAEDTSKKEEVIETTEDWYLWGLDSDGKAIYQNRGKQAVETNDDDDEEFTSPKYNHYHFTQACSDKKLEEVINYWELLQGKEEREEEWLEEGVEEALEHYNCNENSAPNLKWLLEQDAEIESLTPRVSAHKYFLEQYTARKDEIRANPELVLSIYDEFFQQTAEEAFPLIMDGVKKAIKKAKSIDKDALLNYVGLRFNFYENDLTIYPLSYLAKKNKEIWYEGKIDPLSKISWKAMIPYLVPMLKNGLQQELFSGVGMPLVKINIDYMEESPVIQFIPDHILFEQAKELAEKRIQDVLSAEDKKKELVNVGIAIYDLMQGILAIDAERAVKIYESYQYSRIEEVETEVYELAKNYSGHLEFRYALGKWKQANYRYQDAYYDMQKAGYEGYEPAKALTEEYLALAKERANQFPPQKKVITKKKKYDFSVMMPDKKKRVYQELFQEEDLFMNNERIIARAYFDGTIYIRFKVEGEQAYSDALDYLNHLLEKGYDDLNDGYQIQVRFLTEPMFIKGLSFPATSCHAFFAKAVQYPSLREKVKQYAEQALAEGYWYRDLDGEVNTTPGTFAACALALCDEQYVYLAGLYGQNSDGEHQYIQLEVPEVLLNKYGATEEVAKAVFELCGSNGQDAELALDKDLYLKPENLQAIMDYAPIHYGGHYQRKLEWVVTPYVEAIFGSDNTKKNLKKLKELMEKAVDSEAKNIYMNFYNFYKEQASAQYDEEYGEDLSVTVEVQKSKVSLAKEDLTLLHDDEKELAVVEKKEGKKLWGEAKYSYPAKKKYMYLILPNYTNNPHFVEHVVADWNNVCATYGTIEGSIWWGVDSVLEFGQWYVNPMKLERQFATILYDGKNKPWVLYGLSDTVSLAGKFWKNPYTSKEQALQEAKEKLKFPSPLLTDGQRHAPIECNAYWDIRINSDLREYTAIHAVQEAKSEDKEYYQASLIAKTELAVKACDKEMINTSYEAVKKEMPEYTEWCDNKLDNLYQ